MLNLEWYLYLDHIVQFIVTHVSLTPIINYSTCYIPLARERKLLASRGRNRAWNHSNIGVGFQECGHRRPTNPRGKGKHGEIWVQLRITYTSSPHATYEWRKVFSLVFVVAYVERCSDQTTRYTYLLGASLYKPHVLGLRKYNGPFNGEQRSTSIPKFQNMPWLS